MDLKIVVMVVYMSQRQQTLYLCVVATRAKLPGARKPSLLNTCLNEGVH